jgi:uncharacterized protein YndB with AHSA1/START domain
MGWPVHFDLVSQWTIPAPVERVWPVLSQPETWPQWWPGVVAVHSLHPGAAGGSGAVRRIEWSGWFNRRVVIDVEAIDVVPNELLRGRSRGQLDGEGLWLLRGEGSRTLVTYVWRVRVERGWMRWFAPLLAPLLRWNHRALMHAGEQGLTRHLAG